MSCYLKPLFLEESLLSIEGDPHVELAVQDVRQHQRIHDGVFQDVVRFGGSLCRTVAPGALVDIGDPSDY